MKYFNPELMVFVLPGVDGGKRVKKIVYRNIPIGVAVKDDKENNVVKGDVIYKAAKQAVGFEFIDLPENWVQLEDNDPRCKNDLTKKLVFERDEVLKKDVLKLVDIPPFSEEQNALFEKLATKAKINKEVSEILVTVDEMVFDGCKDSQDAISVALSAADNLEEKTLWKLNNNNWAEVSASQLKRVQRAAGLKRAEIMGSML